MDDSHKTKQGGNEMTSCIDCKTTEHHAKGRCVNCYQKYTYKNNPLKRKKQYEYRKKYLLTPHIQEHNRKYMRNYMRKRLNIKKENWRKE